MASSPYSWHKEFTIKKPWTDVMRAAQLKYPNPFSQNVVSLDVVSRDIDIHTGILRTFKVINSSWPVCSKFGEIRAVEKTIVDPHKQYMQLESNNVDMRGVLKASEKLVYEVHPENKDWTIIRHSVSVDAFRLIAYAALSTSEQAAESGRNALLWVINERVDNFMKPVDKLTPLRSTLALPSVADLKQSFNSTQQRQKLSLTARWSSLPSLLFSPLVALASSPESSQSLSLTSFSCANSLPDSIKTVLSAFDSFNPSSFAASDFAGRVQSDVNVIREQLKARCRRVAESFSRIDEYVLIM